MSVCAALVAATVLLIATAAHGGPFADFVLLFTPGSGAGYGQDQFPGIVLGPPHGGGELQGSLDVLSLGDNGVIVLGMNPPVICDGPGPDLTIFENPFHVGSIDGPIYAEYGIVAVSQDGVHFVTFPYDPITHVGLAGQEPVLSSPDNGISPLDPAVSGGDHFDLADVGLSWAAYVRITDGGKAIPDPADFSPCGVSCGFDLDAIAAVHACDPFGSTSPSPTSSGTTMPTPTATATGPPAITATPSTTPTTSSTPISTLAASVTASPSLTVTPIPACVGDCAAAGAVNIADLITGVDIILGALPVSACPAFENALGKVDIAQLIKGVNSALNGCGGG